MSIKDQKQSLIELIEWYRDEWHKSDFYHSEMIDRIKQADEKELEIYEKVVDGWLDY